MNKFLFAAGSVFLKPVDERRYALVRIAFALAFLLNIIDLWFYRELFYSASVIGEEAVISIFPGSSFSLFSLFDNPTTVTLLFTVATAASILLIVSFQARLMLVIVHLFQISVILRAPTAISGWDGIISAWGFILLFSPLASNWGIARLWREKGEASGSDGVGLVPRYGLVLLQVQLAVIYWETVLQRLFFSNDQFWRDGSFLTYYLLSHYGRFSGDWPIDWHETLELFTHATMLAEIAIPILLWIPQMRGYGIILGVLLHGTIAILSVNICLFSLTILLMYSVFLVGKGDRTAGIGDDP